MNRGGYLIGQGFRNIFKHGWMSFATVAIITVCLIIMGSVLLLSANIDALVSDLEQQNEVVAFVDESYTSDYSKQLEPLIKAVDNIAAVSFVSRDDAMKNFMGNYDKELMEGIDASVFRDRFVLQLKDSARMADTKKELESIEGIVKVNAHIDYAESFIDIRNIISYITMILLIILFFISIFIMMNTIKLSTFSRREEIAIMKMVGASNGFIRLPFVVEGLILGILGSLIAFFAEWGVYNLITEKLVATIAENYINFVPFSAWMIPILLFYLAFGTIIGALGGIIAIRNYLKV